MLQYIIVFIVVGIAAVYTIRKLSKQVKGRGCENCSGNCNIELGKFDDLAGTAQARQGSKSSGAE